MPLRNVATTFTIEQQRLEINALAGDVNNIATGVTGTTASALAAGATGSDLTLSGTLTVNGTQTILNTETLQVEDKEIVIGNVSSPTDATAHGGGWKLKGANNKTITYNQTGDKWVSNKDFEAPAFYGDGSNLTGVGATLADAGNANANSTILFSSNATGSGQTLSTDGGLLYNAAEDALKVNGTIITSTGIIGAGSSCVVAAANHSSTCKITVGQDVQVTGDINLSEGKKTIFGSNFGSGAYIKHQSGNFELKNQTGNFYFDNIGGLHFRTGSSYTTALTINPNQSALFKGAVQMQYAGRNQFMIGSTDGSGAAIFLDGSENGDISGGDYSYIEHTSGGDLEIRCDNGSNTGKFKVYTADAATLALTLESYNATFGGTVSDSIGDLRSIPANTQASAYSLASSDAGKCVLAGGQISIPNDVGFVEGDAVTIINNSASAINFAHNSVTLYNTADGTTLTSPNGQLGARGMCTIYFVSNTVAYISGSQLS